MKRLGAPESTENEYYARVSRKLRNAKYLALLLMVVSAFLTLFAYRDRLTYANMRYLLRDIDAAGNTSFQSDTVYYTADEKNTFLYYRDDLAVGSSGGIEFHRALGSRSFSDEINFKAPILVGSDKYMIAYDSGGYSFYVYNSLGRVYNERLDTEIIAAAAAADGHFAVLAKNKTGGAAITVYDKNFKKAATLTRAGDAYTVGFLDDGRLYICESVVENAALYTDVSFYTVGEGDTHGTSRYDGLVLRLGSVKKGHYVLTDRALAMSDGEGKIAEYSFGTADLLYTDANDDGVCVLLKENASGEEYGAYAYFANGENAAYSVPKGAKGIALCDRRVCVMYEGTLLVLSGGEPLRKEIPTGSRKLISIDGGSVIVCYNDYAKIFSVK